jgi:hypothetical protein
LPDETKWRASWWDAKAGKHRRYRLNATSYNEARQQCAEINRKLAEDAGFLPRAEQQSPNDFTVKDALLSAVSNSRGGEGQVRYRKRVQNHPPAQIQNGSSHVDTTLILHILSTQDDPFSAAL